MIKYQIVEYHKNLVLSQNVLNRYQVSLVSIAKQYEHKHRVTATIFTSMGDTLPKVASAISQTNSSFELWGKEQVIVALSQTKEAKDTILIENKTETINALVTLLKTRTQ